MVNTTNDSNHKWLIPQIVNIIFNTWYCLILPCIVFLYWLIEHLTLHKSICLPLEKWKIIQEKICFDFYLGLQKGFWVTRGKYSVVLEPMASITVNLISICSLLI